MDPTHTQLVHHRKKISGNIVAATPGEIELKSGINKQSVESLPISEGNSSKVPEEFQNDEDLLNNIDPQYLEYVNHDSPIQMMQSKIYELILHNVYADYKRPVTWPAGIWKKIKYIILAPHILLQHVTIPNSMIPG